jgi:hypothetical protein
MIYVTYINCFSIVLEHLETITIRFNQISDIFVPRTV